MLAVALTGSALAGFALIAGCGSVGRPAPRLGPRAAERAAWRIGHMERATHTVVAGLPPDRRC